MKMMMMPDFPGGFDSGSFFSAIFQFSCLLVAASGFSGFSLFPLVSVSISSSCGFFSLRLCLGRKLLVCAFQLGFCFFPVLFVWVFLPLAFPPLFSGFFLWVLRAFFLFFFFLFFLLCFSVLCSGFSSPFYREACPSTSPTFAGLLWNPRTRSWARDVVHDRICCRFSGLRLNRDEEDHMAVPPATTTFRQKLTFSF